VNVDALLGYRSITPRKTPVPAAKKIKVNLNTAPLDSPVPAEQNIKCFHSKNTCQKEKHN
jgi:hypothetical protein